VLVIEPRSSRYEPTDYRWRRQTGSLYHDLRAEVGGVRVEAEPAPGEKGAVTQLVLELISSGALTAAITTLRAWLERDRTRTLDVEWDDGERRKHFSVSASTMDDETFEEFARAAARAVAEA
jgi:Effector Associated Constant Component 1